MITVDWSGGNQFPYDQAVANTVMVAAVIRQLLQAMINVGAQPQQMHLIGHSLGAHISSYVGRDLPNLGRISGLGIFISEIIDHSPFFSKYRSCRT
jgi:acetyl esterase/lipase